MVEGVRAAELALGTVSYELTDKVKASRKFARSLFVTQDIAAGEALTHQNVRSVRPSDGLPPAELPKLFGRKAKQHIPAGTPLSWELVE